MPLQRLGLDAGRRADGQSGGDGDARSLAVQVERDDLLGAGVDDVELPVPHQDALRAAAGRPPRSRRPAPVSLHHPARTRFGDQHVRRRGRRRRRPGRAGPTASVSTLPRRDRLHAAGAQLGEHDRRRPGRSRRRRAGRNRSARIVGFVRRGPVAGDLAAGGGDHELAGAGRGEPAQEARVARREQHPHGLQRAVGRHDVEVGAVGDVEAAVVADREVQRPVQRRPAARSGSGRRRGSR